MSNGGKHTNVSRVANASILGYDFQMLMSIQKFMEAYLEDKNSMLVVEGQEDLDVHGNNTEFCQYKYYSGKSSKSKIQEAVAYLFKFWQQHNTHSFKYHLFVHGQFDIGESNEKLVSSVLKLTRAQEILSGQKNGTIKVDENEVNEFAKLFSIDFVETYEKEKRKTFQLMQQVLHGSLLSIEFLVFPEAMQHVHELAIGDKEEKRQEIAKDFVERLETTRVINNHSIYQSIKDEKKQKDAFMDIMKDQFYYQGREYSYVLEFGKQWNSTSITNIIDRLVPLFAYKDNRMVNKPLTFVLDCTKEEMLAVKRRLFEKLRKENKKLIMNDGFENFGFNKEYFCEDPMCRLNPSGRIYQNIAFNFRLVTRDTFTSENIRLKKTFVISFDSGNLTSDWANSLRMDSFNSDFVIACIGGLHRK